MSEDHGIRRGLTNYGDKDFAQYLRNSFARSMGISKEMLGRPIVGIAMTPSGFNNCHRDMPQLVADANGTATVSFNSESLQLRGPNSIINKAVIVHRDPDDVNAQPVGNAGPRLACGVIKAGS